MREVINKTVKYVAMWAEDAHRLKRLAQQTGRTQVELVHEALVDLEESVGVATNAEALQQP